MTAEHKPEEDPVGQRKPKKIDWLEGLDEEILAHLDTPAPSENNGSLTTLSASPFTETTIPHTEIKLDSDVEEAKREFVKLIKEAEGRFMADPNRSGIPFNNQLTVEGENRNRFEQSTTCNPPGGTIHVELSDTITADNGTGRAMYFEHWEVRPRQAKRDFELHGLKLTLLPWGDFIITQFESLMGQTAPQWKATLKSSEDKLNEGAGPLIDSAQKTVRAFINSTPAPKPQ